MNIYEIGFRKTMKLIKSLIPTLLVLLFFAGVIRVSPLFADETPSQAYSNYFRSLQSGDMETYKKYTEIFGDENKQFNKDKKMFGRQTGLNLIFQDQKGEVYKLIFEAVDPNQNESVWKTKKILRRVQMQKLNGQWHILLQSDTPYTAHALDTQKQEW